MSERQDPEVVAINTVLRAVGNLKPEQQTRVLDFVEKKLLHESLGFDPKELMVAINRTLDDLNSAAREFGISGVDLMGILRRLYAEATSEEGKT